MRPNKMLFEIVRRGVARSTMGDGFSQNFGRFEHASRMQNVLRAFIAIAIRHSEVHDFARLSLSYLTLQKLCVVPRARSVGVVGERASGRNLTVGTLRPGRFRAEAVWKHQIW
jgi:hypothetical protein